MNIFGLYVAGNSWLHRRGAGWKYLLLLVLTVPVLALAQPVLSLVALVITMFPSRSRTIP